MTDWSELSTRSEVLALVVLLVVGVVANLALSLLAVRKVRLPAAMWLLTPVLCSVLASLGPLWALNGGAATYAGVVAPGQPAAKVLMLARGLELIGVFFALILLLMTSAVAALAYGLGAGPSARWSPAAALPLVAVGLGGTMAVAALAAALQVGRFGSVVVVVLLVVCLALCLLGARATEDAETMERLVGARALVGSSGLGAVCALGWLIGSVSQVVELQVRISRPSEAVAHRVALAAEQLVWAGSLTIGLALLVLTAALVVALLPSAKGLVSTQRLKEGLAVALLIALLLAARLPWWESGARMEELAVVGGDWHTIALADLAQTPTGRLPAPGMMTHWTGEAWRGGPWIAGKALPSAAGPDLALPIESAEVSVVVPADALAKVLSTTEWAQERVTLHVLGGSGERGQSRLLDLRTTSLSWWPEVPPGALVVAIDEEQGPRLREAGEEHIVGGPLSVRLADARGGVLFVPGPTWTVQDVLSLCAATPGPCGLSASVDPLIGIEPSAVP